MQKEKVPSSQITQRKQTESWKRGDRPYAQVEWLEREYTTQTPYIMLRLHGIYYVAHKTADVYDGDWILEFWPPNPKKSLRAEVYRANGYYDKHKLKETSLFKIVHTDCPRINRKHMALDAAWARIK